MVIDWKVNGRDGTHLFLAFDHGAAYNLIGAIIVSGKVAGPGYECSLQTAIHYDQLLDFAANLKQCRFAPSVVNFTPYDIGVQDNGLDYAGWEDTSLTIKSGDGLVIAYGTVVAPSTSEFSIAKLDFRFALDDEALKDAVFDFDTVLASFGKPTGRE